ncbi:MULTISPECIES: hypothetical protein [Bacillus]|nr:MULTISPECIES: hypothetical protein [Bacillus]TWK71821.1 hypothetical protein CHCC20335_2457 [Bacillus paralicheniformis]MCF7619100.1 hypothetical protein [Bacillus sonorensis]MCY7855464.1 hypothetical protein [Bacillus sonorensis]MCY8025101.1 hypothetical protein [Bacillus sonorensis]MCY8032333.1 hypothetical protein [Bacillus sonorensis]
MGTIVMIKDHELTVLEDASKALYTKMIKDASDREDDIYISWKEDLDSEYGY